LFRRWVVRIVVRRIAATLGFYPAPVDVRVGVMTGRGKPGMMWAGAIAFTAALVMSGGAFAHSLKQISGLASYYGKDYRGRVASGGRYDPHKFTAAHRSLPFGTHLRVTNPRTHRSVTVVVNDRGPFIRGRVLDLSFAAAEALHMTGRGVTRVVAVVQ
jgi:rare lipoprotein A